MAKGKGGKGGKGKGKAKAEPIEDVSNAVAEDDEDEDMDADEYVLTDRERQGVKTYSCVSGSRSSILSAIVSSQM